MVIILEIVVIIAAIIIVVSILTMDVKLKKIVDQNNELIKILNKLKDDKSEQ